jgi:hypothetical protein
MGCYTVPINSYHIVLHTTKNYRTSKWSHHISDERVVPKSPINVYQMHCLDAQLMKNKMMCMMFILASYVHKLNWPNRQHKQNWWYQFILHTTQNYNWTYQNEHITSSICITIQKKGLYLNLAMVVDVSWYNTVVDPSNGTWWPPVEFIVSSGRPPCLPIAPNVVLSVERRPLDDAHEAIINWMRSAAIDNTGRWLGAASGRSNLRGGSGEISQVGAAAWRRWAEAAPAFRFMKRLEMGANGCGGTNMSLRYTVPKPV